MGGAIFNHAGTVDLTNVSISGNAANGGAGGDGSGIGGAIFNLNGAVSMNFCTIAANSVSGTNGNDASTGASDSAIYSLAYGNVIQNGSASAASLRIANSIVYGNGSATNDVANNVVPGTLATNSGNTATVTYVGANIIDSFGNFGLASSVGSPPMTNDPKLEPLQNNGGNTQTMALQADSPAIDAAIPCAHLPATDQRGNARIWGSAPDLGAYEYGSSPGRNDDIFRAGFDSTYNCP
ncbi:hypothetical protein ELE36_03125 [Pseudolysobacter antarcticus]|uniref:Uncharacterized protein n=2 Tax=Pseudolysobacter antarcticus TaxID=2511995 RepID=A0A411HG10_9GAMM|nr:hypothetical protein ELE36_03125 [Pseudolysobacter antarcticus]